MAGLLACVFAGMLLSAVLVSAYDVECSVFPAGGDGWVCPCDNNLFCGGTGVCEFNYDPVNGWITAKAKCNVWVISLIPHCELKTSCETPQQAVSCGVWSYSTFDCGSSGSYVCRNGVCNAPPQCDDGIDNDLDGCVDYSPPAGISPDDGCMGPYDNSESPAVCCEKVTGGLLGNGCTSAACPAEGDIIPAGCSQRYPDYPACCCKAGYRFNSLLRKCVERRQVCDPDFLNLKVCFTTTTNPADCIYKAAAGVTKACCSGSIRGYDYDYLEDVQIY